MWPCLFWTSEKKCKRFGTGPKDVQYAESFSFVRLDCCVCYVTTMEAAAEEDLLTSSFFFSNVTGLAQKLESLDTIRDMTRKNSDSDEVESLGSMR